MAWDLLQLIGASGGGGLLGLVAGSVSREARFNQRVDTELKELRNEVKLCRAERTQFAIVKTGILMVMPELRRLDRENPILVAVQAAYEQLPSEDEDMATLLRKLKDESDEQDD